ncbi:MAG: hypothetical protein KAQ65_04890 [Candidatus Thorarchaeota archaeon]|nr:hypothetical protein [Candidatus Thorarchaeota archaeon]
MRPESHRSKYDSRIETFFLAANVASIVAVVSFGVFYLGYILTHDAILSSIQEAILSLEFQQLQAVFDTVTNGILGTVGWVRLAMGLGLVLMSFFFIANTGGIVFSVFIHRSFSAGGTPTVRWWRLSLSRTVLTLRLLFFIALYRISGYQGFLIIQEFFPNHPVLNVAFFLNSALSLGTLIVLASVIKVVVYETARYETLVEENRQRISESLGEYLDRWDNDMILLREAMFSNNNGYVKAKLEDATRNMSSHRHLVESSYHDLQRLSSPNVIIRKVLFAFIGVIIMQMLTDVLLYVGWGTILDLIFGILNLG